MPLKVSVGLSKKIGQPDYGSLGASCHVEYEADSVLLFHDLDTFHRQVKAAFVACKQAVQDELLRHKQGDAQNQANGNNGQQHNGNGHSNGRGNQQRQYAHSQDSQALDAAGHTRIASSIRRQGPIHSQFPITRKGDQ